MKRRQETRTGAAYIKNMREKLMEKEMEQQEFLNRVKKKKRKDVAMKKTIEKNKNKNKNKNTKEEEKKQRRRSWISSM
jgi:hypothetical protein